MKAIRATAGLMLAFLCCLATAADPPKIDGVWLKNGIEAYNRIGAQNQTRSDLGDGMFLAGFLGGIIAAQRDTTFTIAIIMTAAEDTYRDFKQKKMEKDAELSRTAYENARIYVPRFNIPDGASLEQCMAVVLKYLTNHPEKWQNSASSLVRLALTEAFPEKALTRELK